MPTIVVKPFVEFKKTMLTHNRTSLKFSGKKTKVFVLLTYHKNVLPRLQKTLVQVYYIRGNNFNADKIDVN